jgi:hypothetical protein
MKQADDYRLTHQNYPSPLDATPLEIRESRGMMLLITMSSLAIGLFAFYKLIVDYHNHYRTFHWIIGFILLPIGIYSFISVIKPKLILRIDEQGVWEKKSGLTPWPDIDYFYTSSRYQKHSSEIHLYYHSIAAAKEIKVDLSMSQYPNDSTIRRYIELFKGEHDVADYGRQ